MSRKLDWWMVVVIIALSNTGSSHCKLAWEGSIGLINGFTSLTNTKKHAYGQTFNDEPFTFKYNFTNGTVHSFSVSVFFAIVPEHKHKGSHDMAFVISPTRGLPDEEFGDVDDNHVGININGMESIDSHPAGYYDQVGQFRNLSLISGKLLRVTILYSQEDKQLNVTLSSPEEAYYPDKPLLSLNQDLSPYVLEKMYVGFSASTGLVGAMHYMWSWFFTFDLNVHELDFPIPTFPPYPNPKSQVKRTVMATFLTILLFIGLVASALSIFFYKKHKMVKEVLEEWEIQCGPHRFSYKELFKATKGFSDKQLLGKGGFGQVFKGKLPGSDTEIAVKRISHDSRQGMQEFLAEISTIGRLRHQNLVRLQGYCRYKEQLYLVYDFMPNGSLDKYLYRRGNQEPLTWNQRFKIIKDVAYALCYLHHEWGQVVIHRDIKPANVLIDHHMDARLGDFGLAKFYDQVLTSMSQDPRTENNPYLGFIYTSFQERATFISHGNTARQAKEHGDLKLAQICGSIAADEKRHETAYTKIVEKLFGIDPDGTVVAFADMMRKKISMPAHLMYDGRDESLFDNFSSVAQRLGVYTAKDYADILEFLVGRWKIENLTGLSGEGNKAQDYLCGLTPRIRRLDERAQARAKKGPKVPFSWIHDREVQL
ncbi:hypothetical protein F2Q68_00001840 [Brassica cretica]|uniref:Acyl-[acyl-carrier-protein] desaturase n=1 Tax=Brassica cretica TaxID=69181 RepID=A0A8S9J7T3_BRACR|nr:hypothetical protein F2Q68_00001840 [Brassica cretica]